jgi:hypothetical protein
MTQQMLWQSTLHSSSFTCATAPLLRIARATGLCSVWWPRSRPRASPNWVQGHVLLNTGTSAVPVWANVRILVNQGTPVAPNWVGAP